MNNNMTTEKPMSNEEVIEVLKGIVFNSFGRTTRKEREALDIAIRTLETRPQGEWIEGENGNIKCNKCGCEIRYSYIIGNKPDFPKFCCDCGADMQKGGKE